MYHILQYAKHCHISVSIFHPCNFLCFRIVVAAKCNGRNNCALVPLAVCTGQVHLQTWYDKYVVTDDVFVTITAIAPFPIVFLRGRSIFCIAALCSWRLIALQRASDTLGNSSSFKLGRYPKRTRAHLALRHLARIQPSVAYTGINDRRLLPSIIASSCVTIIGIMTTPRCTHCCIFFHLHEICDRCVIECDIFVCIMSRTTSRGKHQTSTPDRGPCQGCCEVVPAQCPWFCNLARFPGGRRGIPGTHPSMVYVSPCTVYLSYCNDTFALCTIAANSRRMCL